MAVEHTQIKLAVSEITGELIGFVSRNPKSQKLMGVREDSRFGKKICILAEELKGKLQPNKLYKVGLKAMHKRLGYVIISAEKIKFNALVEMHVTPNELYQVTVSFGNKTIYFDPINGGGYSSRNVDGVIQVLREQDEIANMEEVLHIFTECSTQLLERLKEDGHTLTNKY